MKNYFNQNNPIIVFRNSFKWFLLFLLFVSNVSNSDIYYIDSVTGVDTNNGTTELTPWKNVSKVNLLTIPLGSRIYLKCKLKNN